MRFKTLIAVTLALVILVTLAAPAFAGKPSKGEFQVYGDPLAQGEEKITIQATHDNHLKVTVVLKGATPGNLYTVVASGGGTFNSPNFRINDRGVGRWSGITTQTYTSATTSIRVFLNRDAATRFYTPYLPITFK
jgi:hypothetical protein